MAPKAQAKALAGRGRPKRDVAPEAAPAPVANTTPAKRGRPGKAEAVEAAVEPPKKRGRPGKATEEEATVEVTAAPAKRGRRSLVAPEPEADAEAEPAQGPAEEPKKVRGRPKKHTEAVAKATSAEAPAPKQASGRGRPRKEDAPVEETPATPKRGRPAKTAALDLSAVTGSPRISKRTSPRTTKTKPSKAVAATPRLNPRIRSKLRTRVPSAQKSSQEAPVVPPSKRGRPKKTVSEPAPKKSAAAKNASGRKPSNKAVTEKPTKASVAKPAKESAPRKRRGFTTLEIPDKFAKAVKEFYQNLFAADAVEPIDTPPEDGEAAENEEEEAHLTSTTAGAEEHVNGVAASKSDSDGEVDQQEPNSEAAIEQDLDDVLQAPSDEDEEEDQDPFTPNAPFSEADLPLNIEQVVQHEQTMAIDSAGNLLEEFNQDIVAYAESSEQQALTEQDRYSEEEEEFRRPSPKPSAAAIFATGF